MLLTHFDGIFMNGSVGATMNSASQRPHGCAANTYWNSQIRAPPSATRGFSSMSKDHAASAASSESHLSWLADQISSRSFPDLSACGRNHDPPGFDSRHMLLKEEALSDE